MNLDRRLAPLDHDNGWTADAFGDFTCGNCTSPRTDYHGGN